MSLRIADHWFERERVDDAITLLTEPHLVTMERLATLPVTVVHAGHDPSMDRDRFRHVVGECVHKRMQH